MLKFRSCDFYSFLSVYFMMLKCKKHVWVIQRVVVFVPWFFIVMYFFLFSWFPPINANRWKVNEAWAFLNLSFLFFISYSSTFKSRGLCHGGWEKEYTGLTDKNGMRHNIKKREMNKEEHFYINLIVISSWNLYFFSCNSYRFHLFINMKEYDLENWSSY